MEKMPEMAPTGAFVPTNPDYADILGDTTFHFENLYFWTFRDTTLLDLQIPGFFRF